MYTSTVTKFTHCPVSFDFYVHFSLTLIAEEAVERFLESLVANKLMVTDGKNYLSLALCLAPLGEKPEPEQVRHLSHGSITTQ